VEVKICGIGSQDAADAALRAGADFAGLVFHPKSPRFLGLEQAGALAAQLRGRVRLVALVADAGDEEIAAILRAVSPAFLQLHGGETPARAAEIRSRFGVPVIKAFAIAEPQDFAAVPAFEDCADMYLFDARAPGGAARRGGHGVAFDWQLLRGRSFSRRWFLAGGLNPDNVARAIRTSGAPAVDVSSGVESAPGVKSRALIGAFIDAARAAQHASEAEA